MSVIGLLIVLFLVSLLFKFNFQSGGANKGAHIEKPLAFPSSDSSYLQQYYELHNVDNVLKRKQYLANEVINNVTPNDGILNYHLNVLPLKTEGPIITKDSVSLIESKQPYFLDDPLIVKYYGVDHYWDWRFPRQPIRVEFAKDPSKYIKDHPDEYPSYIIKSRNYKNLQPLN